MWRFWPYLIDALGVIAIERRKSKNNKFVQRLFAKKITGTCLIDQKSGKKLSHSVHYQLGNLASYRFGPVFYHASKAEGCSSIKQKHQKITPM